MRGWQNGLAVVVLTFFGLLALCALLGSRVGRAGLPATIQVAGMTVIALVAGLASAMLPAVRRRLRVRDWHARLARADALLSRAPAAAAARAAASGVTETITVVLRRQIPPRPEEPPRSWLGGLPMLPEGVAWPRAVSSEYPDRGERALHFAAQICCADLPHDLWAGLGPRRGWLLLFIDPNQGEPQGPDAFRILLTEDLGSERAPPADLGPVQDGVYAGWDYQYCGGGEEIPRHWRRWPVDLVAMPNGASVEGRTVRVAPPDLAPPGLAPPGLAPPGLAPPDLAPPGLAPPRLAPPRLAPPSLAQRLYAGAPVVEDRARPPAPAPFTRRGALYALNAMLPPPGGPRPPDKLAGQLVSWLQEPGCVDALHAWLEALRARQSQRVVEREADGLPPPDPGTRDVVTRQDVARTDALLAVLAAHATPAALIAYLDSSQARSAAWRDRCRGRLERLRETWREGEPDAPLTAHAWADLQAEAAGEPFVDVGLRATGRRGPIDPNEPMQPLRLVHDEQRLRLEPGRGIAELVADYYVDPARRALIPPPVLADFEPYWRRLVQNRPHRMGGYHDGVQSDAMIGPTDRLLLFQLASDDAMQWCWGDAGAYYIYISPADLRRGDFGRASIVLECH